MTDTQNDIAERLTDAMLSHVRVHGWRGLTVADIAEAAEVSAAQAYAVCPDRAGLLDVFARRIDLASVSGMGPVSDDRESRYDRLLDILMMRFEALQPHRESVSILVRDVMREPETLLRILPQSQRSFAFLAEMAGYPHDGLRGAVLAKALSAVWLSTQRVWLRDESADLTATMHALDRNLRRALETLGPVLGPEFRPADTGAEG